MLESVWRHLVQKANAQKFPEKMVTPVMSAHNQLRMKKGPIVVITIPQILKNALHIPDHPTYCHPFCIGKRLPFENSDPVLPF